MNKLHYVLTAIPALILLSSYSAANAQEAYPIVDKAAEKVISHYQTSSCEQLMEKKMHGPSAQHAQMEERVMQQLRNDPRMRMHFLNKVAGPIANKMFECGMIP